MRGLFGCLPPRLLYQRCDLVAGFLGGVAARLLCSRSDLPGQILGCLLANLLARLLGRRSNPQSNLFLDSPTHLLFNGSNP
jgi:hypothetical protein